MSTLYGSNASRIVATCYGILLSLYSSGDFQCWRDCISQLANENNDHFFKTPSAQNKHYILF